MYSLMLIAGLAQIKPGPIDAFRANLAQTRVNVSFSCTFYRGIDWPSFSQKLARFEVGPGPADSAEYIVLGRWGFDGKCEHYVARIVGGTKRDPDGRIGPMPPAEALTDGDTYVYHYLFSGESVIHFEKRSTDPPLLVVGPFTWASFYRFDREIENRYSSVIVEHKAGELAGRRVETEVYDKVTNNVHVKEEIFYDPAIGYVPRYCRAIAYTSGNHGGPASVRELYVLDAKRCSLGGFVPTEWYRATYHVKDSEANYNDVVAPLAPSDSVSLVHFVADKVEDGGGPVRIEEMAGVTQILATGGVISEAAFPPMSLLEMKQRLGKRGQTTNKPRLPNIDSSELHEFDQPASRTPWAMYIVGGIGMLALLWCTCSWRRGRLLLSAAWLFFLGGCGEKSIPAVTAAFVPDRLIYDASKAVLQLKLVATNSGNRTLGAFGVNAGCSCRQVDVSRLPAWIRPGDTLELSVGLSGLTNYPQSYLFKFETDHGPLTAHVSLVALPDHHLSP